MRIQKRYLYQLLFAGLSSVALLTGCGGGGGSTTSNPASPNTGKNDNYSGKPILRVINEVLATNKTSDQDPDFNEFGDWIELQNSTGSRVDLSRYGLSDSSKKIKWTFPDNTILESGEYLIVWADNHNFQGKALHTNFKLSGKKDSVVLFDTNGQIVDRVKFKKQPDNISISRNSNDEIIYMNPSLGKTNNIGFINPNRSQKPTFSKQPGYFADTQSVSISAAPNSKIYYTLDSSSPSQNSTLYTGPINISTTATISAIAVEENKLISEKSRQSYNIGDIFISEIMAENARVAYDPDYYEFSDWIEIYNNSSSNIDLGEYKLSDGSNTWTIPSGSTIPAKGYKIFWADGNDQGSHTNFKLKGSGGEVILYDKTDKAIDKIVYKKQKGDISYGKDSKTFSANFMKPSFAKANGEGFEKIITSDKPDFSIKGGFYKNTQKVTLSTKDDSIIHYTLDGSYPTENSPTYSGPISITPQTSNSNAKATVLKARSFKDGLLPSKVHTATYFINMSSSIPVMSISINDEYMYDDTIGMYVVGTNGVRATECNENDTKLYNYARSWEKPAHIAFYETNGTKEFSMDMGLRISGQCSRHHYIKSFEVLLRNKYGKDKLKYKLFKDKDIKEFTTFKLRSGGGNFAKLDDPLVQYIVKDATKLDYQAYTCIALYMNGNFFGVFNIRERKGPQYFTTNYPEIDLKKLNVIKPYLFLKIGDRKEYMDLIKFVERNTLADDANYQKVADIVDIDQFINYMITHIYAANSDWPGSNNRVWNEQKEGSPYRKFRWMLEDIDQGFKISNINLDSFNRARTHGENQTVIFDALLGNSEFKAQFKAKFNEYLNSIFLPGNVIKLIDEMADERREEIPKEMNLKSSWSVETWENAIQELRDFAEQRPAIVKSQLDKL